MQPLPPPPDITDRDLSGLSPFRISVEENAALCRSTGVEPAADGTAHPAYAYIASQVGMGASVAELCTRCGFDVADGPMITGSQFRYAAPLRVDAPYRVDGEILSLTRKPSRAFGVMDLLTFELRLVDQAGAVAASALNTWALPRRELAL